MLLGTTLALAAGLVISLVLLPGDDGGAIGPVPANSEPEGSPSDIRERTTTVPSVDEKIDVAPVPSPSEERRLPSVRLRCLRSANRRPLAGIHLYAGLESVAGPTKRDGVLEVPGNLAGPLTVWGPGWLPREVPEEALPEEVFLEAADASLVVQLVNAEPGHHVARTLIQPHTRLAMGGGPWEPRLTKKADGSYRADRIPSGDYDVYFWVSLDGAEPRPLSINSADVRSGEDTNLTLDLSTLDFADTDD